MSLPHTSRLTILKTSAGGKFCTVLGWFCLVFFFIFVIVISKDKSANAAKTHSGLTVGYLGCALGIGLVIYGIKTKRLLRRLESYMLVILNTSEKSIERIANAVSRPPDFVLTDLRAMLGRNFFSDAFIDVYTSEIILRDMVYRNPQIEELEEEPTEETADSLEDKARPLRPESAVVTCKGCGATNKVARGTDTVCDFCGSPLSL